MCVFGLLVFLLQIVCPTCEQGMEVYWDNKKAETVSTAHADSTGYSGSHVLELRGSFIAQITETHKFTLSSETYSVSSGYTPHTHFTFDGLTNGPGTKTWYYQNQHIVKDFRYAMRLTVTEDFYYVRITIGVSYLGFSIAACNQDLIGTCEESGCRDESLSRSPYACMPSPTRTRTRTRSSSPKVTISSTTSKSPSWTALKSPSRTTSKSPSWTALKSPSLTTSMSPLVSQSPFMSPAYSPLPTLSPLPSSSRSPTDSPSSSSFESTTYSQKPSSSEPATYSQKPSSSEPATYSQKPSSSESTTYSQKPSSSESTTYSQKPSSSQLTTYSEKPNPSELSTYSPSPDATRFSKIFQQSNYSRKGIPSPTGSNPEAQRHAKLGVGEYVGIGAGGFVLLGLLVGLLCKLVGKRGKCCAREIPGGMDYIAEPEVHNERNSFTSLPYY